MKEIDIDRVHTVLTRLFLVVCCGVLATACVKDPQKGEDTPDGGESASKYFSYATTREYTVAIDYGFSDYQVLFEIYGGNPLRWTAVWSRPPKSRCIGLRRTKKDAFRVPSLCRPT